MLEALRGLAVSKRPTSDLQLRSLVQILGRSSPQIAARGSSQGASGGKPSGESASMQSSIGGAVSNASEGSSKGAGAWAKKDLTLQRVVTSVSTSPFEQAELIQSKRLHGQSFRLVTFGHRRKASPGRAPSLLPARPGKARHEHAPKSLDGPRGNGKGAAEPVGLAAGLAAGLSSIPDSCDMYICALVCSINTTPPWYGTPWPWPGD